jgi:hypothetical protein
MVRRASVIALLGAAIVLLGLIAMPAGPANSGAELGVTGSRSIATGQGLVHRADIYRICEEIRRCWTTRNGNRRCGPRLRCRECRFERRCRRATGCQFEEVCKWGPPRAPVPQ